MDTTSEKIISELDFLTGESGLELPGVSSE